VRHNQRHKLMFAVTLALLAATAMLINYNDQFVFQNEGRLVVKQHGEDPGAVIFIWRSDVEVPMARRFEEGFDEWKDRADRIIIDLHSPGGAIREGEAVIRAIERMKRTHIVDTRVRGRRKCYSMCVPIFLQGDMRSAASDARFMFHEPTAYDFFTGEKVDEPAFERARTTRKFFNRYFVNSPMTPSWRNALAAEWKGKDVFRTGRELVDENAGIVTVLE